MSAEPQPNKDAKIIVYWLENSRAQRIIWLLEELKVDYEIKVFKRGEDKLAPKELKQIHPLGKSPVIGVQAPGAEKPVILAESGTIVEYLAEYFGPWLIPKRYPDGKEGVIGAETEEWLRYKHIMHYSEGSLMTVLIVALVIMNIKNAPVPFFLKPITRGIAGKVDSSFIDPQLKLHLDFLENQLATSPNNGEFFCGKNLSGADVQLLFAIEAATQRAPITADTYPKLYNYMRRLQGREAYERAAKRVSEASGEKYVPFSELKEL